MPDAPARRSAPDLDARLRDAVATGTPTQRRLASFVLQRSEEAAFASAAELGSACGTSAATVVRFAQQLGFDGYTTFRHALQSTLKARLSLAQRLEQRPRDVAADPVERVRASLALDARLLAEAETGIDAGEVAAVARDLAAARHVHVVGLRGSAALAELLGLLLRKAGLDARAHTHGDVTLFDGLRDLSERDVVVAFSFARYARRATDALALAAERGARSVAITDSLVSPPARAAERVVVVGVASLAFQHSYVAAVGVVNALLALVSAADEGRTIASLEAYERVLPSDELLAP